MSTLQELLAQQAEIAKLIAEKREQEGAGAIAKIHALMDEFGISLPQLIRMDKGSTARSGSKVTAKYLDPATGKTWTGRGKAPRWLDGKERNEFLIDRLKLRLETSKSS